MRDRKAYYCMFCGSGGHDGEYDEEADKLADEFLDSIDSSNKKYGKFKR